MRKLFLGLFTAAALAATGPASAGLLGTTATSSSPGFGPTTPSSATVVSGGAPEFAYDIFLTGDVDNDSFTLRTTPGDAGLAVPSNAVILTVAETIIGITVNLGPAIPALTTAAFSFSGSTLQIAIGAAGFAAGDALVATVTFEFAPAAVPEPVSLALLSVGLLGLAGTMRRRS